jgi:predicted ArsR family transcriptional regulator
MEDFLKAVPLLTIEAHNPILEKQIEQLTEKTRDNEYIIKAKLQEKDEQLKTISSQFSELKTQMQSLMSSRITPWNLNFIYESRKYLII